MHARKWKASQASGKYEGNARESTFLRLASRERCTPGLFCSQKAQWIVSVLECFMLARQLLPDFRPQFRGSDQLFLLFLTSVPHNFTIAVTVRCRGWGVWSWCPLADNGLLRRTLQLVTSWQTGGDSDFFFSLRQFLYSSQRNLSQNITLSVMRAGFNNTKESRGAESCLKPGLH